MYNSLPLPRAPGIRNPCEVSQAGSNKPHFLHHLREYPEGNVRATALTLRPPKVRRRLEKFGRPPVSVGQPIRVQG